MKVFLVASAICLIGLVGQIAAITITESESESLGLSEHLKLKIHQTETIRPVEPTCSCKHKGKYVEKVGEKVFVNRAKPLYVTGKSRRVVVPAGKSIVVKPAPVVIRQKGDVEVRPIHITKQPPPLIVTKKIVKLHRPIIKKYYVEKYRRQEEGLPAHIVSQKVSKKTCDCPVSEHVISPKYHWDGEESHHHQAIKVLKSEHDDVAIKVLQRGDDAAEDVEDVELDVEDVDL